MPTRVSLRTSRRLGTPAHHQRVADVEDAVGVVQSRGDEHYPEREGGRDTGGTE